MIAAFARFDLLSWFLRKQTLLTVLFVVVVGVFLPVPGMAIVAAGMVTSLMVSTPFLGDERGRLDTLYGVLPISRRTVVIGRALSLVAYYVTVAALATVVTAVMAISKGNQVPTELMLIFHAAALAIVGLSMALQLPVFFRIGYSRGRLMSYAPTFVVAGLAWLLQATGLHRPLQEAAAGVSFGLLAGIGVLLGLAGISCAIVVSVKLYRRREL